MWFRGPLSSIEPLLRSRFYIEPISLLNHIGTSYTVSMEMHNHQCVHTCTCIGLVVSWAFLYNHVRKNTFENMVICVYKLWIIKSLENRCVLVTLSANKKTRKSMQLYYVKYCSSANWSSYMYILSLTSSHTFWYQHGHVWKIFSNPMSPHPGSGTYMTHASVCVHT